MNKNELKKIACQGEGCGREAYQEDEDEDYYVCGRCGWAGSSNNPVVVLQRQLAEIREMYEEANHHLDLMVERFGIEALVEMIGEEEE